MPDLYIVRPDGETDKDLWQLVDAGSLPQTVSGLAADDYQVAAAAISAWSDPVTVTGAVAPAAIPDANFAVLQDGTIRLYQNAPSGATDVEYQINSTGSWVSIGDTDAGDYSTTADPADTVRLRAVNSGGESDPTTARTVGDQIFYVPASTAGLTSRWVAATPAYSAGPPPSITTPPDTQTTRGFVSLDEAGVSLTSMPADIEVYGEYVFTGNTDDSAILVVRGAGAGASETGVAFRDQWIASSWTVDVVLYDSGTSVGFSTTGLGGNDPADVPTTGVPYCMRAAASGNTFTLRRWLKSAGEPSTPNVSGTYAPNPVTGGGRIGFGGFRTRTAQYRCLGVGINGAPAPRPLT